MSYLPTWIAVAVGLCLFVAVLVLVSRHVRRFSTTAATANSHLHDEVGTLRARSAALRVAMKETRTRVKHAPAAVRSDSRGRQEDDRG